MLIEKQQSSEIWWPRPLLILWFSFSFVPVPSIFFLESSSSLTSLCSSFPSDKSSLSPSQGFFWWGLCSRLLSPLPAHPLPGLWPSTLPGASPASFCPIWGHLA